MAFVLNVTIYPWLYLIASALSLMQFKQVIVWLVTLGKESALKKMQFGSFLAGPLGVLRQAMMQIFGNEKALRQPPKWSEILIFALIVVVLRAVADRTVNVKEEK